MDSGFVVRVTDSAGRELWIAQANAQGRRSFSARSDAAIFSSQEQAQLVVNALRLVLTDLGTVFTIEPV